MLGRTPSALVSWGGSSSSSNSTVELDVIQKETTINSNLSQGHLYLRSSNDEEGYLKGLFMSKALECFKEAADLGSSEAQEVLGKMHLDLALSHRSEWSNSKHRYIPGFNEAKKNMEIAISYGNTQAHFELGELYQRISVVCDKKCMALFKMNAIRQFEMAQKAGHPYALGRIVFLKHVVPLRVAPMLPPEEKIVVILPQGDRRWQVSAIRQIMADHACRHFHGFTEVFEGIRLKPVFIDEVFEQLKDHQPTITKTFLFNIGLEPYVKSALNAFFASVLRRGMASKLTDSQMNTLSDHAFFFSSNIKAAFKKDFYPFHVSDEALGKKIKEIFNRFKSDYLLNHRTIKAEAEKLIGAADDYGKQTKAEADKQRRQTSTL